MKSIKMKGHRVSILVFAMIISLINLSGCGLSQCQLNFGKTKRYGRFYLYNNGMQNDIPNHCDNSESISPQ